jgi:16S rRNA (guanine1516-N2)-methyltransferase
VVKVIPTSSEFKTKAEALAGALQLPFEGEADLYLVVGERLELREATTKTGPVYVDFEAVSSRQKQGKDLIAKAVGVKGSYRPTIIDATAGLGQDAFTLAAYGCTVHMVERSPVIAALLADGLERARELEPLSRLSLQVGDAREILKKVEAPDVVYLDPMYPDSGKSAAKRKEMRLFRELVGDDTDVQELLAVGLETATKRVVIKRPLKAPTFGKPSFITKGTTLRFDVYLTKSLPKI